MQIKIQLLNRPKYGERRKDYFSDDAAVLPGAS
jgi:hypothetical protein